jgi:hypothetical protein
LAALKIQFSFGIWIPKNLDRHLRISESVVLPDGTREIGGREFQECFRGLGQYRIPFPYEGKIEGGGVLDGDDAVLLGFSCQQFRPDSQIDAIVA